MKFSIAADVRTKAPIGPKQMSDGLAKISHIASIEHNPL